jgi:ABC-type sugar transport system ATPase subunit
LAERDARRFVGRDRELGLCESFLSEEGQSSVLLIHGPGGIGKSALLRELARRAEQAGLTLHWIEGRDVAPAPDALESLLADAQGDSRPLVIFDTYERIASLGGYLRRGLLPSLSDSARVVIAGRNRPEEAWFRDGWEAITTEFELQGVSDPDAQAILRTRGVDAGDVPGDIIRWAAGSPLALTLAAAAAEANPDWEPDTGLDRPEIVEELVRRLTDEDVFGPHLATMGAAAIARVTTPELLAAAIPGCDPQAEFEWLATRHTTEPVGAGIAYHDLVARALRGIIDRRNPELERDLRLRIADHLYERAVETGQLLISIDLAHLAEDPTIRWGYSWEASGRLRLDDATPADAPVISNLVSGTAHEPDFDLTERLLREAPAHVATVRDSEDRIFGYTVAMSPRNAPAFVDADHILGPRLAHARERAIHLESVIWRDVADFSRDPGMGVIGMLGMAGILRSAQRNPRFAYLPIDPMFPGAREFADALGAEHITELDATSGKRVIECHLVDYGHGGLLAAQRELVYRELGLEPPATEAQPEPVRTAVRDALRRLDLPHELANSPLATGGGMEERAASVRALIEDAAENAFGRAEGERQLKQVLVRGYIDPAPSHELAADELSLSRAAYFRRLRTATERIADYLAARQSD